MWPWCVSPRGKPESCEVSPTAERALQQQPDRRSHGPGRCGWYALHRGFGAELVQAAALLAITVEEESALLSLVGNGITSLTFVMQRALGPRLGARRHDIVRMLAKYQLRSSKGRGGRGGRSPAPGVSSGRSGGFCSHAGIGALRARHPQGNPQVAAWRRCQSRIFKRVRD